MESDLKRAVGLLKTARKVVALTGAGVSTESGIPDFRSAGGLWSRYDPYEYGTLGAFQRDPRKVWQMLQELIDLVNAQPNKGHMAMARLEAMGILQGIITQNIDGLHQKAGSRKVIEFHGSMASFTCPQCYRPELLEEVLIMEIPPHCPQCKAILKPDVIFFDEQIPQHVLAETEKMLNGVDCLLVVGTSCQVIPASMIPAQIASRGGAIIEINIEPSLIGMAELSLVGKFSGLMSALVRQMQ